MRGTTVVDGHGVMVVEQVGDATGYGKVYEGSQIDNNIDTPLQIQLKGLANVISKAGYAIAAVTFIALTAKLFIGGQDYLDGIDFPSAEFLYGGCYSDCSIGSRRFADECDLEFGFEYESDVEDE